MLWSPQKNSSLRKRSAGKRTKRGYWQRTERFPKEKGFTLCQEWHRIYRAVAEVFAPEPVGKGSELGETCIKKRVN